MGTLKRIKVTTIITDMVLDYLNGKSIDEAIALFRKYKREHSPAELRLDADWSDECHPIRLVAIREENDEEYAKRKALRAKDRAATIARKREQEARERMLLAELKEKYES